jgi:hypothetical protein
MLSGDVACESVAQTCFDRVFEEVFRAALLWRKLTEIGRSLVEHVSV